MQIDITGHHIEISPALRDYTTEKMARLERHFDICSALGSRRAAYVRVLISDLHGHRGAYDRGGPASARVARLEASPPRVGARKLTA